MNQKEFEQKLTEVADWRIPDTLTGNKDGVAKKSRGRKSAEEKFQAAHEEIFLEIHGGKNPTFAPKLDKIKVQSCTCEDCGAECPNGRHKEYKLYETNHKHWRERCVTCNKFNDPYTNEFTLVPTSAASVWARWLRTNSNKPYHYQKKSDSKDST